MKQLLFLLLFPCFALAQYPGNGNQKITLGEQTSADGLVYRGLAADTTRKPSVDTMAYILLDTNTNIIWQYKKAVNNAWTRVGGSISSGVTGVLPVANGGTGSATKNFVDLTTAQTVAGVKTFTAIPQLFSGLLLGNNSDSTNTFVPIYMKNYARDSIPFVAMLASVISSVSALDFGGGTSTFNSATQIRFNTSPSVYTRAGTSRMFINGVGNIGIGTNTPQSGYRLHVVDSVYVGGRVSAAGYTTRSDYDLKDEIQTLNYGLNEVIQMQPVKYTYKSNGEQQLGFIAQDIGTLIPESVHFDEFMGVDYQSIIPILTKAIQEQQALIKALEQRILNLENK